MPCFNYLRSEKAKIAARTSVAPASELFGDQSSLSSLDEDFKIALITSWSDLQVEDVVKVLKADPSGVNDMVQYATQLPMRVKLPMEFLVRTLLQEFLSARRVSCGNRLTDFKARGGVQRDGSLSFKGKTGAYDLRFNEAGLLVEVIHNATGESRAINPKTGLCKDHILMDNYDDHSARLVMEPMPPFKLMSSFDQKSKQGPWSVKSYYGKPRELAATAKDMHEAWLAKRAAEANKVSLPQELKATMDQHRAEKRSQNMVKARTAATTALAKKRARRSIVL